MARTSLNHLQELTLYQVDAFSSGAFTGNPAGVCVLDHELPERVMQAMAEENNVAETAFCVQQDGTYSLRWFTPTVEVPLCGHATLATAHVLFSELAEPAERISFATKSGELSVRRADLLYVDLPATGTDELEGDEAAQLSAALGCSTRWLGVGRYYVVELESEACVKDFVPDMQALVALPRPVVITAPASAEGDFVSRFFAPQLGVPEDPATGSAHCQLVPYWATKLGKTDLSARQLSRRGAKLRCSLQGGRVELGGGCYLYLKGSVWVPHA